MATQVSIPDTEIHSLRSEIIGDDFELWIAKPQAGFMPAPPQPPEVLFVLDANLCFGTAVEMTRLMHKLYGELPPIVVVGIAYPTENGLAQSALRNRDFTPSADAGLTAMASSLPASAQAFQVDPPMGGAEKFLRFLQAEVKPFLASRIEGAIAHSTIFGSSLGGLFVTYALLSEPDAFKNYIAVSPALWWDNEMMFDMKATQPQEQSQKHIFLAAGELEEAPEIPILAQFKMITNAQRMAKRLSSQCDLPLSVASAIIPGETHTSVIPVALTRGLRSCFHPAIA
ncbi:MAG: alpha/beta hydrolase-fold protein [Phormidesmis sp.]